MTFDNYTVRLIQQSDTADYFSVVAANKARLEAFFPVTVANARSLETLTTFVEELLLRVDKRENYPYIVIDNDSGKIIGYIHVKNIDWDIPKGELGFFIDEHYAGKGILKQAMTLIIDYLFHELGFEKIYLRTHESNGPARRLAEKCGFEIEGRLRKDHRTTAGELVDLFYYGLLKH
ncbi:MAG: GNAT family protein [Bacteroidota bacterium]